MSSFIIPTDSPLRDPLLPRYFCFSLIVLHTLYHGLANTTFAGPRGDKVKLKQRAWILTTFNGFVMTLASLPYLVDLVAARFDLHAVHPRTKWLAEPLSCFFVAYLLSDLTLGSIYYRKLINLSSGWIHHFAYTLLFAWWLHKGWSHIAVMACVFELPTFIMGMAALHPPLRSNAAFTGTFFLTRVFFHFGLFCAAVTPHGRSTPGIDGSWGPVISLAATYPMHVWWGYKCVRSIQRRMHKRKVERRRLLDEERAKAGESGMASYFADSAGQFFNGLANPDTASALNTPAATPGHTTPISAPANFAETAPLRIATAFQRAARAAAERNPIKLSLGRRRRRARGTDASASESEAESVASVAGASLSSSGGPASSAAGLLQVPASQQRRGSTASVSSSGSVPQRVSLSRQVSSSSAHSISAAMQDGNIFRPFTTPVRPEDAGPDARPPFLDIRSPAETKDKARRLVADAVRSMWFKAPKSWRDQFEAEAQAKGSVPPIGFSHLGRSVTEESTASGAEGAEETEMERTRAARARAAARRTVLKAVRRAISGKDADAPPSPTGEGEMLGEVPSTNSTARTLKALDLQGILKRGGLTLPPDLTGQQYVVREFPVERESQGGRSRRMVGALRRRMEVARRDVVVWD